jgi:hypothetical protein
MFGRLNSTGGAMLSDRYAFANAVCVATADALRAIICFRLSVYGGATVASKD